MFSSLLRRYKLFFLIGLLIIVIQIYLAYKSFNIPLDSNGNNSGDLQKQPFPSDDKEEAAARSEKLQQSILSKIGFQPECDISGDREVGLQSTYLNFSYNFHFLLGSLSSAASLNSNVQGVYH